MKRLRFLLPWQRRIHEREMREELESLRELAGPGGLGNVTLAAENARQLWHFTAFDGACADFRYALRTLRRQPGLVAVAVISLALGIGANSAIFSLADAVLLRPLPIRRPAEVLSVANATPENPMEGLSYPDFRDLRRRQRSFSGMVAFRSPMLGVAMAGGPPRMLLTSMVSENLFETLGVLPLRLPDEPVAVLGYDYWKNECGSDPAVVGRTLRVNGVVFRVIAVAPATFTGLWPPFRPSIYLPLSMWGRVAGTAQDPLEDRQRRELAVKGRLAPGATRSTATAEFELLGRDLERAFPSVNRNRRLAVRTELGARILQSRGRLVMVVMLFFFVGLVLAIACANVANLLLARAHARGREMAIRAAIGAGRLRLARQTLTESLLLAAAGCLAGLGVAVAGMRLLGSLQLSADLPFVLDLHLDTRVLLFGAASGLAACLLSGMAPAVQAARTRVFGALDPLAERRWMLGRKTLAVGQVALSVVLLVTAGMFLEALRTVVKRDPGFRTDHRISMGLDPRVRQYTPERASEFFRQLRARVRALPGVKSAALAASVPYSYLQSELFAIPEGYHFPPGQERAKMPGGPFDEHYFTAMGIGIVRGRGFTAADRTGSRLVAVVNQEFARVYWPGQDPIGKRLRLERTGPPIEVIGMARNARCCYPTEPAFPYLYLPYEQHPRQSMSLITEAYGDPAALAPALREAVRALDPDLPISDLRTLAAHETRAVDNWMIFLDLFAAMATVGLLLAMVGLYGLMSYTVVRRTREIGVRVAIGANRADVLRLVLRQGLGLAAVGIVIGGAVAASVAPRMARAFVGEGSNNPAIHIAVPAALLAASLLACWVPARRAAALDPLRALRHE